MGPIRTTKPALRSAAQPRQPLALRAPRTRLKVPLLRESAMALHARLATHVAGASTGQRSDAAAAPGLLMRPNPYLDYGQRYTAEGEIAISYKDVDQRLWRTIVRVLMWLVATGFAVWFAAEASPLVSPWLNGLGVIAVAVVNWLILRKPDEVYRQVEIRPDCMIIESADVFWRENMELGWPSFRANAEGHQVLCGVYGTRFVEYLTVRRFDDNDRAPEVFAAHLQAAMQQQWENATRRQ